VARSNTELELDDFISPKSSSSKAKGVTTLPSIEPVSGKYLGRSDGARRTGSAGWSRFAPTGAAATAPSDVQSAEVAAIGLDGLLALQNMIEDAGPDAKAHKHGTAMLRTLTALQRLMLSNGDPSSILRDLADMSVTAPVADDPGLATAISAVILRARVELARHGR
jgi:hypothetical protein